MIRALIFAFGITTILFLDSCSGTRRLAEGEVLYIGTRKVKFNKVEESGKDWEINNYTDKKVDGWLSVMVAPNGAIFGLPFARFLSFRLFLYNLFYTQKEKGFSHWMMENFGEPPITVQSVNPGLRVEKIENDLFNRGHFGVKGEYVLKYKAKRKKARIRYVFDIPEAYTYRGMELVLEGSQQQLQAPIRSYLGNSLLKPGREFNLADIAEEKERLWRHLQNQGYYYIKPDNLLVLADTTAGYKQVDLQYRIDNDLPEKTLQQVFIADHIIDFDTTDIARFGRQKYQARLHPRVMNAAIAVQKNSYYSLDNTQKTLRNLSSLGVFTDISVNYEVNKKDSSQAAMVVHMSPVDEVSFAFNGDVALKNTGFIGPALGFTATHKNLFGGAENLILSASGYLDFPTGVYRERSSTSSGYSIDATLNFPVLHSPLKFINKSAITLPRRSISVSFEQNNRVDYFRIANWKASYGFNWMSSPRVSHQLNLINLSYSHLLTTTPEFDSLVSISKQVEQSFRDQFIFGPSYSFVYNNTTETKRKLMTYYKGGIEFSGNILNSVYSLFGEQENGERTILGVQFSQYARLTSDFRLYWNLREKGNQLVFRNIFEFGQAYGNSIYMPYIKQFFVGGSNSLRPFNARVIGPGRYIELENSLVNQVGDIRIETNLEYRFPLFYKLKGALWSDFGNVWLHKDDPDRPLTGIRWGKIPKDSYLTAGVGVRLDFDYFVARLDYGALLYAPLFIDGYRWIWQNKLPLHGMIIGIGYPF